jgi:hypothetical protein
MDRPQSYWATLMTRPRFRIIEWTSEYKDGSRKVEYELLKQTDRWPDGWQPLGTSSTLEGARKALLFYTPYGGCWAS